ncbi:MAG: glycosyltransferase family 1 protein [Ginsengibacter sp.]
MDLVCFSHLRWNFVYQRPQHLLNRFTKTYRVFYIEEPIYNSENKNYYHVSSIANNLLVVVLHLEHNLSEDQSIIIQRDLLNQLFHDHNILNYWFWYYTPMALTISNQFNPRLILYDCMDELSAFKFAPPSLKNLENELFQKADIVFTGGYSLYDSKKTSHHNIYPFPSSIDKDHFAKARGIMQTPADQAAIPGPRFGFYGVLDERFDLELLAEVASRKPEWQFIIIGPVVKIDQGNLPILSNIHYLGSKNYDELPAYLNGWDIAIIPFLLNDSTRYISPTKTPEYLAAGKPVISSSIADVVNPYAINNLVMIADNADDFIKVAEKELNISDKSKWLEDVDILLSDISWDKTWLDMAQIIENTMTGKKNLLTPLNEEVYV